MSVIQGIYKIENIKNKKVYIGQSKDIYGRFKQHERELKNNTHHSSKLQRSYNKTVDKSVFKFSILEIVDDYKKLDEREQFYINFYDSFNSGYNCCNVGFIPTNDVNNIKNKKRKYYQNLFSLLSSGICVDVGKSRLHKIINSQGYDWKTIQKLCIVLKWFNDCFSVEKFSLKIGMNHGNFVAYIHNDSDEFIKKVGFAMKNKRYVPTWIFEKVNDNWEYNEINVISIDQCVY